MQWDIAYSDRCIDWTSANLFLVEVEQLGIILCRWFDECSYEQEMNFVPDASVFYEQSRLT